MSKVITKIQYMQRSFCMALFCLCKLKMKKTYLVCILQYFKQRHYIAVT